MPETLEMVDLTDIKVLEVIKDKNGAVIAYCPTRTASDTVYEALELLHDRRINA